MLNPAQITDAVVVALQGIPELAAAMTVTDASNNATVRISAFHYLLGADHRLAEHIYKMPVPSMLVVWEGTQGGNFSGYGIWKHRLAVYMRMGNAAGATDPVGYEQLWWTICNRPVKGSTAPNIRYMNLVTDPQTGAPLTDIMDTPSIAHLLDEDQIDIFRGEFVVPEIGDN